MLGPNQFAHELRLPTGIHLPQDEEWCEVVIDGHVQRIRFHDYAQVYAVPGLYEHLFRDRLCCVSPQVVCSMLAEVLAARRVEPDSLRVLDVGAGNGMVAEQLAGLGIEEVVGVDVLPAAAAAAERDRPNVYRDYFVADLAAPPAETHRELTTAEFGCATMVGSLGFGDVSPDTFVAALSYVTTPGWVGFSLRERFLSDGAGSGFGQLIGRSFAEGVLRPLAQRRYRHRYATSGKPVYYVAIIAEKSADMTRDWIESPGRSA
jgi:SAM-dependent methyltransferase